MTTKKKTTKRRTSNETIVRFIPLKQNGDARSVCDHLRDLKRVNDDDARVRIKTSDAQYWAHFSHRSDPKSAHAGSHLANVQAAVVAALREQTSHRNWVVRVTVDAWKQGEPAPEKIKPAYVSAQLPSVKAVRVR